MGLVAESYFNEEKITDHFGRKVVINYIDINGVHNNLRFRIRI